MKDALLYAMLMYGAIALVLALVAVALQAVLVSLAARLGNYLLAVVPALGLGAGALGIALSKRDLQLYQLYGGMPAGDGAGAAWITRLANLALLAIAIAKLAQMLFAQVRQRFPGAVSSDAASNRHLLIAFLAYAFCSLVLPMAFGTQPAFSHDGFVAVPMFAAAYLARREPMDRFLTSTKWTLLVIVLASLVIAAIAPKLAVSKYVSGLIPGLSFRLWGLSSHPNVMGAMTISLMLMLWLRPSKSGWLQFGAWLLAVAAVFLTQSKTSWLASLLAFATIVVYRRGRDAEGRVHIGVWISMMLAAAVLASGLLFIDVSKVMGRFLDSDVGTGLTTLTGRTRIWEVAMQMWLDSPWFGYGPDAWSPAHRVELGVPYATQAHNQLLEAVSEGGLAYAVPMLLYFALLGKAAVRSAQWTRGVSIAFFLVIAVRCITEAPFGIGNMTSVDMVLHLILFMIVVREQPSARVVEPPEPILGKAPRSGLRKGLLGA